MLPVEREERILAFLQIHETASVSELSKELSVSEPTIRRDLLRLSGRKLIRRVHGGAVLRNGVGFEPPVVQRRGLFAKEKERIGRAAAALVNDGETVILVGGSTTLEVVPHLAGKRDLTVITDSILIAERAAREADITVILLGGIVCPTELTVEGYLPQLCMRELHANKAIIGARAVNFAQGLMLDKVSEVTRFRECMRIADEVILVADHSKFGQVATAVLGPLTLVDRIVTDSGLPAEIAAGLREVGIEAIEA